MNKTIKILLAMSAGIVAGAVVGVLYAPEEGAETRRKLKKKARKFTSAVGDSYDQGRESLEEIKDTLQKELHKVNRKLEDIKI